MIRFRLETTISAPVEKVFDLARDIDAHKRSLAHSNETAVAGVTSGLIEMGESVTWKATHFGIPFKMTSAIVEMNRPTWFVDQQSKGPFKTFRHEHAFQPHDGGTLMVDDIMFESPLGPIGKLVNRAVLGRYMENLITTRNSELKAEAEHHKG